LYVVELDAATNRVIVGPAEDLLRSEFEIANCSWLMEELPANLTVKIRYNHPGCPASVVVGEQGRSRVMLPEPQRAITPGQAAVVYQDDLVIGGGWIC